MSKSAEKSALEARDVSKRYDGAQSRALNSISLAVKPGEFYSFLGPSGCGKTTLLRIFAGFEEPSSGRVLIDGQDVVGVPPYRRPVNMVFQSYALFPHMTILENVAFGLRAAKKLNKSEIIAQSKEALATVRLSEMASRLPAQLSGGQQQRVALARALVMRPVVLLLDEPLSALDVRIREEMQEELLRLHRQLGLSFVMVTHDQSEALALSSRIAVFNKGNLEQIGSPQEIYSDPLTPFAATFIGRSNLLPVRVTDAGAEDFSVEVLGRKFVVPRTVSSASIKKGDRASLCFKPEDCSLAADPDSDGLLLPGVIASRSYQGSLVDLRVELDLGPDQYENENPNQTQNPDFGTELKQVRNADLLNLSASDAHSSSGPNLNSACATASASQVIAKTSVRVVVAPQASALGEGPVGLALSPSALRLLPLPQRET